jgi:hypothetical protein
VSFLPNANAVRIDSAKLRYLLTSGKSAFVLRHGFDPRRPSELAAALRQHPVVNPLEAIFVSIHGFKFTIRCALPSPDGRNPCAFTVWIFDPGATEARFVTGYASPANTAASSGGPT